MFFFLVFFFWIGSKRTSLRHEHIFINNNKIGHHSMQEFLAFKTSFKQTAGAKLLFFLLACEFSSTGLNRAVVANVQILAI